MAFALPCPQLFSDPVGESYFASGTVELVARNFAPPAESFDVIGFRGSDPPRICAPAQRRGRGASSVTRVPMGILSQRGD